MLFEHVSADRYCTLLKRKKFKWSGDIRNTDGTKLCDKREPNARFLLRKLQAELRTT
jgi:hypothetical protein